MASLDLFPLQGRAAIVTGATKGIGRAIAEGLAKAVDVNLRGPVLLLQAAAPHLRKSAQASVINVVSSSVWMFLPQVAMYSATKGGLVSFTRSAAAALVSDGIRVNALAPGPVDIDKRAGVEDELYRKLVESAVMKRAASSAEMVGPAVFLASDASSYMTGSVLHVDGGTVAV